MTSRVIIVISLLLCVAMTTWAQLIPALGAPLDPDESCFSQDCGVEDVTPESGAKQRYRLLSSSPPSADPNPAYDVLYVGFQQQFLRISPNCAGNAVKKDPWIISSTDMPSCEGDIEGNSVECPMLQGSAPTLECDNYIRTVEQMPAGDANSGKILVCATRDAFPRCYSFNDTCDLTPDGNFTGGPCTTEGSYNAYKDLEMVARNWDLNTTMTILHNGVTGTRIFVGSSKDVTLTNAFVGIVQFSGELGSSELESIPTFTLKAVNSNLDARHVNRANFVGRFQYTHDGNSFVLFFYREDATEHINQGKIVFSRVARICQDDNGFNGNAGAFQSFIKARLNCSLPASVPKYYNEIQDVYAVTHDSETGLGATRFYAAFTTPSLAPPESAVCVYSLQEIHDVFTESDYRGPDSANELFTIQPRPNNPVRGGDPGEICSNPHTDSNFINNYPLMNDTVNNVNYNFDDWESDRPLFYSRGVRFSSIVVDNRDSDAANVIFVGADDGQVWKVYEGSDRDKDFQDSSVKLWASPDGSPITGLGLIKDASSQFFLYATTHTKVMKINLQYGRAQDMAQALLLYSPYLTTGFMIPSGVISSVPFSGKVCNGHKVTLLCQGNLADSSAVATTQWKFIANADPDTEVDITASGLGHFAVFYKIRDMVPDPLSYLYITTHKRTSGVFKCVVSWGANTDTQVNTVTVEDCITDGYVSRQGSRKAAVVSDAAFNRGQYNTNNANVNIEYGTCDNCPWN